MNFDILTEDELVDPLEGYYDKYICESNLARVFGWDSGASPVLRQSGIIHPYISIKTGGMTKRYYKIRDTVEELDRRGIKYDAIKKALILHTATVTIANED